MEKVKTLLLENKVRLVLSPDEKKNQTETILIVNFNNMTRNVLIDNKKEVIPAGLAHLLEHTIAECSKYGNSMKHFNDDFAKFNASTSNLATEFFLNTIVNFYDHLVELINIVNEPIFDERLLDEVKKPVIEEIKRGKDRTYEKFNKEYFKILYSEEKNLDGLGDEAEVRGIRADYLKLIHSSFYKPENQTIYISGNFNVDKVVKIIEDTYAKLERKKSVSMILDKEDRKELYNDFVHVVDPEFDPIVDMIFKVDISSFSPKDKVKLSFYIDHFLEYNFGVNSKLGKNLKESKKTSFNINANVNFRTFKDYMNFYVEMYGTDYEYFKDKVLKIIENPEYDEELFNLWKRNILLDVILRNDNCFKMGSSFLDNIMTFNYFKPDTVKDIEDFTFEDYKNTIEKLDFSNYSLIYETKD